MNPATLALFSLLNPEHIAQIAGDGVAAYATIAHGEGGVAKVLSAIAALGKLLEDAAAMPQLTVTQVAPHLDSPPSAQATLGAQ